MGYGGDVVKGGLVKGLGFSRRFGNRGLRG